MHHVRFIALYMIFLRGLRELAYTAVMRRHRPLIALILVFCQITSSWAAIVYRPNCQIDGQMFVGQQLDGAQNVAATDPHAHHKMQQSPTVSDSTSADLMTSGHCDCGCSANTCFSSSGTAVPTLGGPSIVAFKPDSILHRITTNTHAAHSYPLLRPPIFL